MRLPALVSLRTLALCTPLVLLACSSKDDGGTTPAAAAFTARFELPASGAPEVLAVPFPSDLQLNADGTIAIGVEGLTRLVPKERGAAYISESLARTKGYGVYGGAVFELTGGAPDPARLPQGKAGDCTTKDSAVFYVDLDAGKLLECRAAWNDDQAVSRRTETTPVLVVQTARGVVLPEKHKIAVLVTSGIVTKQGLPLSPSQQFAAIRDGARGDAAAKTYGEAIDAAATKAGIDKKLVVGAAVYTTGPVTEELREARELARATAVPTLKWGKDDVAPVTPARFTSKTPLPDGWNASIDDFCGTPNKLASGEDDPDWGGSNPGIAHDNLGSFGVASFDAPNFLVDAGGYGDPSHGTFFHQGGKLAINPSKPTNKIWVSVFLPKGTMPAGGWPVMVFQHGMGGQRGDAFQLANSIAKRGWATVSIEAYLQGTRGLDARARGDDQMDYKRATTKYEGPDGFVDRNSEGANTAPTDLFGNMFRLAALRDQFRQTVVDHTTLLRVLQSSPTLDGLKIGDELPKIDGTKVAYFGDSLGGILGSLLAGVEPNHAAYILNVPGGALLSELASNSPGIYSLLNGSAALNFGFQNAQMPPWHPLVQMMQHVIDGGDPIGVASTTTAPIPIAGTTPKGRNLVLFEVLGDELVSNEGTEAMARAMGVQVVTPHGPLLASIPEATASKDVPKAGQTALLVQLYPAQHGVDFYGKHGDREYGTARSLFGDSSSEPFPKLDTPKKFENPYLEAQKAAFDFVAEAFEGKTPTLIWTKAPAPYQD